MKVSSCNKKAFFELLQAGLWEQEARFSFMEGVDFSEVYSLSMSQSVVGLVAAGLEHVSGGKISCDDVMPFSFAVLKLEQRNTAMSLFTADVVEKMYRAGLHPLLVKGQGLAQCYERPLWRSVGDIDFFFSKEEFEEAVSFFTSYPGRKIVQNARYTKSFGVAIDSWLIEVHGSLRDVLSSRLDREIDKVQEDIFRNRKTRIWKNGDSDVYLPDVDNDSFLVFAHLVRHFYKGGASLRQLCDWCRLLWYHRQEVSSILLEKKLRASGLMDEWKAFAALVVKYLKMPEEAMPLYSPDQKAEKRARLIMNCVLEKGGLEKNILEAAHIFLGSTLRFLPSLLFNVNGLKIMEWSKGRTRMS